MVNWLLIRANASTEIGTGHVMRCLALAQAWQHCGGRVLFLLQERLIGLEQRLISAGCAIKYLPERVAVGSIDDVETTIAQARNDNADWVVVDGYGFNAAYQQAIKQASLKLLFVDDYGHCDFYAADLVLNQNVYATEALYLQRSGETRLLLGCDYVLLREEFRKWAGWHRKTKPIAHNLLVTLGGADSNNQTLKVLQALALLDMPLQVKVLIGVANNHQPILQNMALQLSSQYKIEFLQNAVNMPELIADADLAVCAGGSTNWELAFLGLPTLIITIADNQHGIAHELHKQGVGYSLGWFDKVTAGDVTAVLHTLIGNETMRREMSRLGQKLVDGFGAERIVIEMQRENVKCA